MTEPPNGWTWTTLGRLATFYRGGTSFLKKEYTATGTPVLTKGDVKPKGRIAHGGRFVDTDYAKERNYRFTEPGDLLITTRDLTLAADFLGLVAAVPRDRRFLVNQGANVLRVDESRVDQRFFVYWTATSLFRAHIKSRFVGSTQIHIRKEDVFDAPVVLPPLSEQRAIAHILGTLDDKIELNRRMNETLEEMARAIFKSWFVDFDPVWAKAEGRQPEGMSAEIAELFPDSFEESKLGEIPAGWEVRRLAEQVDLVGGGTPKTTVPEYWGGPIPWFSVADAPRDGDVWVIQTAKAITQEGLESCSARLLAQRTTIVSARGTVGKCALVGTPMAMNQSCYAILPAGEIGYLYTYFLIRNQVGDLQRQAHGSVFDTITRATFQDIHCVAPPPLLTEHFDQLVGTLLSKIRTNLKASQTLAALRDTLLPKFLSGEIRVPEAEQLAGEAA